MQELHDATNEFMRQLITSAAVACNWMAESSHCPSAAVKLEAMTTYHKLLTQSPGRLPASFSMYSSCVCRMFESLSTLTYRSKLDNMIVWTYLARPITEWYNSWHCTEVGTDYSIPDGTPLWLSNNFWESYKKANHRLARFSENNGEQQSSCPIEVKRLVCNPVFFQQTRLSRPFDRSTASIDSDVLDLGVLLAEPVSSGTRDPRICELSTEDDTLALKALPEIQGWQLHNSTAAVLNLPQRERTLICQGNNSNLFVPIYRRSGDARTDSSQIVPLHRHFHTHYASSIYSIPQEKRRSGSSGVEVRYADSIESPHNYEDIFIVEFVVDAQSHLMGIAWDIDRVAGHAELVLLDSSILSQTHKRLGDAFATGTRDLPNLTIYPSTPCLDGQP